MYYCSLFVANMLLTHIFDHLFSRGGLNPETPSCVRLWNRVKLNPLSVYDFFAFFLTKQQYRSKTECIYVFNFFAFLIT